MLRLTYLVVGLLAGSLQPVLLSAQNALRIEAFLPAAQSMVSAKNLEIVIEFSDAVAANSITSRSFHVFGRWTGVCPGNLILENNGRRVRFRVSDRLSAGEWVTVTLSRNIRSVGGQKLSQGFAWNFWTTATQGSLDLEPRQTINVQQPGERGIRTYGAYAGDLDGDGFHDFTVPNEDASDVRVFLNHAGEYNTFSIHPLPSGSKPSTNEGADFDGDGLLDFACGNIEGNSVSVFRGDGTGRLLSPISYPVGAGTRGLAVLDLNGDGAWDIVTANRAGSNISRLINKGDGTFESAISQSLDMDRETTVAAADFNEDGLLDVAVGSYNAGVTHTGAVGEIAILLSDGAGGLGLFSKITAAGDAWMLVTGDVDNDGHVDVVSANALQNELAVFRGDGTGNLATARTYAVGGFPLAIDLGDLDGDGDLEVVTSNFQSANWTLYENGGSGNFINPRTLTTLRAGSCAVLHDRDRDGDLDMTGIDELTDNLILFENAATPTGIRPPVIPGNFELHQSFPNPLGLTVSRRLTIPFTLRQSARVQIDVLNLLGQRVAKVLDASLEAGEHSARFVPRNLPAGIYFYRLVSQRVTLIRKAVFLP